MWLFTTRGFYSAVENPTDHSQLIVRARARKDLEALRDLIPGLKIQATPKRDYQFRIVVTKDVWASVVAKITSEIEYPNFKDAVHHMPGGDERSRIYGSVWATLLDIAWGRTRLWDDIAGDIDYFNSPRTGDSVHPSIVSGVAARPPRRRRRRSRA